MQKITFSLSIADDGTLAVTKSAGQASQYDAVMLEAQLSDAMYADSSSSYSVSLYIQKPTSGYSPSALSDYSIKVHMLPDVGKKGRFYLWVGDVIGKEMSYGDLNSLYYEIVVIKNGGSSYQQPISSLNVIQMYKTNAQYSYEPDDFANLFAAIRDIKEALL